MSDTRSEVINAFDERIGEALIAAGLASISAVQRELSEQGGLQHIQGIGPASEAEIMDVLEGAEPFNPDFQMGELGEQHPQTESEEELVSQDVYQFDTEYEVVEAFENLRGRPAGYEPGDTVMNLPRELGLRLVRSGAIREKSGGLKGHSNPRPVAVRRKEERIARARAAQGG